MQSTGIILVVGGLLCVQRCRSETAGGGGRNIGLGQKTPQGQSDTGRNPSPPLFPEPLQEPNTKALIPSKIKLPADRIQEGVGGVGGGGR